jgi:hypothetical protein
MYNLITSIKKLSLSIKDKSRFTFVDLFCGIGVFHIVLNKLIQYVFLPTILIKNDKKCKKTYKLNFNIEPKGDINLLDISKYNIWWISFCFTFFCRKKIRSRCCKRNFDIRFIYSNQRIKNNILCIRKC